MKSVWISDGEETVKNLVQNECTGIQFGGEPYDLLFGDPSEAKKMVHDTFLEKKIHNDTLLLIDAIHSNTYNLSLWEDLKKDKNIRVTVDMFHCGAVFFRQEQAEEHFKIRI